MHAIVLDNEKINYQLKVSQRRTLGLEINRHGELVITAPKGVPLYKVEEVLLKKKNWILNKLSNRKENNRFQPMRKFQNGETIMFLGQEYHLKISIGDYNTISDEGKNLFITVESMDHAKNMVNQWVTKEFEIKLNDLIKNCVQKFNSTMKTQFSPEFKVRKMHKRWGSCSVGGRIRLSHTLFTAKPEWIEYVIYHEMSHLIHHDHSANFYHVLATVCPQHKELKQRLHKDAVIYLEE